MSDLNLDNALANARIAVDGWNREHRHRADLFFLTHMHSDHTSGLDAHWDRPLYCSRVSKILLCDGLKVPPCFVNVLELNEPHLIPLAGKTITVTPIDARHCPGACMFLFVGSFGKILHTGDFRFCKSMRVDPAFQAACKEDIDYLYIDNTYCSPACQFGSRSKATAEIIKIIRNYPRHRIVIGIRTLGRESMLVDIAEALQSHIYVSAVKFKQLELLRCPNVFTMDRTESRIHAEIDEKFTKKPWIRSNENRPEAISEMNEDKIDTIYIEPTALYSALSGDLSTNISTKKGNKFVVKYSDHSSFSELRAFVKAIRPRKVHPILARPKRLKFSPYKEAIMTELNIQRVNMSCFDPYLNPSPLPNIAVQTSKPRESQRDTCTGRSRVKRPRWASKKPFFSYFLRKTFTTGFEYETQSPEMKNDFCLSLIKNITTSGKDSKRKKIKKKKKIKFL